MFNDKTVTRIVMFFGILIVLTEVHLAGIYEAKNNPWEVFASILIALVWGTFVLACAMELQRIRERELLSKLAKDAGDKAKELIDHLEDERNKREVINAIVDDAMKGKDAPTQEDCDKISAAIHESLEDTWASVTINENGKLDITFSDTPFPAPEEKNVTDKKGK